MGDLGLVAKREILGKDFTVYGTVEDPLFLAKDVAEVIEYSAEQVGKMLQTVDDDEKVQLNTRNIITGKAGNPNKWFLTEGGLYEVLMQSRKPIAKQFKKEVKKLLRDLRLGNKVLSFVSSAGKQDVPEQPEFDIEAEKLRFEKFKAIRELSKEYSWDIAYKQSLDAYAMKALTGDFVLPLPNMGERDFSTAEVSNMLGISRRDVDSIAIMLGLKRNGEYGSWYEGRNASAVGDVYTFRFTMKAIEKIREAIA